MLNDCLVKCPDAQWEGRVAKYPFWQVAYHTLIFTDLYLSWDESAFKLRDLHPQGWKEFNEEYPSRRFERPELLRYVRLVRQKGLEAIAGESAESMERPVGFKRRSGTRCELYVYNIRHLQHHVGQLGAFLRRIDPALELRWVGHGWKDPVIC